MGNPLSETNWLNSLVGAKGDTGQKGEIGVGQKGAQGSAGTGVTLIGNVPDVAALPAGGNTQGDAYIVQLDDSMHIWNGSAWIDGGPIQGPQGDKGADGQKGEIGVGQKGDQGDQGGQGNVGVKGDQGAPGPSVQGDKGDTGDQGGVGEKGDTGAKGDTGDQGGVGVKGDTGAKGEVGVGVKGDTGDGQKGDTGSKGEPGVGGGGGATKYLLRLEYDVNENLVTADTTFVTATGFTTAGASIVSQVAGGGALNHTATLNFGETNPPVSIVGYGWNPATANYTVVHFDRDQKQVQYEVGISAFTEQATTDGASGNAGQWGGAVFSGAQNYNITVDVDQQALSYGNAVSGGFGNPAKLPHAYLVITF